MVSTPQFSMRVSIVELSGAVALAVLLAAAAPVETEYEVRVLQVWAGGDDPEKKPPQELKPHLDELRKRTGETSFRLAARTRSRTLKAGGSLALDLPSGYRAEWTVEEGGIRQTLTNPEKKQSSLLLKRSPVFTGLKKIRADKATFQLIVEFHRREE